MARLNTHLSATPQPARSARGDSLYRDPTPSSQLHGAASTVRDSSYSVMSPARSMNSDKENDVPASRDNTPKPKAQGRRTMVAFGSRLPTPSSGSTSGSGNKRRRTDNYDMESSQIFEDHDSGVAVQHDHDDDDQDEPGQSATPEGDDEDESTRFYDPNQDPETRRKLRANIRNNHREMEENRDELIKPGNDGIMRHLQRQHGLMGQVKQTSDATLDSRVLVLASDLATRKLKSSLHGNAGVGIDVDQFVSRCINFMRNGGSVDEEAAAAEDRARARRRQRAAAAEDEEEDTGDGLDWAVLGRQACFPNNKRPPVPSFLLGPLSVQKRTRATQTRRAKSQRQPTGPATRPQELKADDLKQSENTNLTTRVTKVRNLLGQHILDGQTKVEQEMEEYSDDDDEEAADETAAIACRRHRIRMTDQREPCVSLFDFVINPHSFGQSVENLFYVSFLIREGHAKILADQHGLPLLLYTKPFSVQERREQQVQKHQAVFSLDWPTWKKLIEAFDIKTSLIPHREPEVTAVAAGGWYS
ncbi:Nse4 C-terminal-domain-containing protein [Massariosphaeria phaeospora]|uniref:Non-structural maintenance of chromosomes element 4 n=1 Tax=Massariosphaeria phaeospora TaxID=100035 RepID=A0A7C8MCN2_9PLEO|nr:Nse4 C-terminal-domain-containing protein [Massariosphaeria phaeospora]